MTALKCLPVHRYNVVMFTFPGSVGFYAFIWEQSCPQPGPKWREECRICHYLSSISGCCISKGSFFRVFQNDLTCLIFIYFISFQYIATPFINAIKPHIEEYWSDDVEKAWRTLFDLMTYYMTSGMRQTSKNENSFESVT